MAKAAYFLCILGALGVGACGDRAGDPVLPLEPLPRPSNQDIGGGIFDGGTGTFGIPGGPCTPCQHGEECGGRNDFCVENQQSQERFCAVECDMERQNCPNRYRCSSVGGSNVLQCLPDSDECDHVVTDLAPSLDVMRAEAVRQLNLIRTGAGIAALAPSECLDELAQRSATELAETGDTLGVFGRECEQNPAPCQCGWSAENERRIFQFALTWEEAIDHSIDRANDPDDSLFRNLTWPEHVDVGFGIVLSGDAAWTAISFGRR